MSTALLSARGVSKAYRRRGVGRSLYGRFVEGRSEVGSDLVVQSLVNIDLDLHRREILGLIGPSGSGKSTLARCLAWLEVPDSGEILFEGRRPDGSKARELARARRGVQMVFQDPVASVNPKFSVTETLLEPFRIAGSLFGTPMPKTETLKELLAEVDLPSSMLTRRARSLSGGQVQRLVIARALATEPRVLVLDESLSGLDLSLRARLVNLLLGIIERRSLSCVLITHDPKLAHWLADRVLRLDVGRLQCDGRSTEHAS